MTVTRIAVIWLALFGIAAADRTAVAETCNDQIVVVDPNSYRIVAVLEV